MPQRKAASITPQPTYRPCLMSCWQISPTSNNRWWYCSKRWITSTSTGTRFERCGFSVGGTVTVIIAEFVEGDVVTLRRHLRQLPVSCRKAQEALDDRVLAMMSEDTELEAIIDQRVRCRGLIGCGPGVWHIAPHVLIRWRWTSYA